MWHSKMKEKVSVQTMIDILNCDIRQFDCLGDEELDNGVEFCSDWGTEYSCTLREIKYTYQFCKKLLEMCSDAGYVK